MNIISGNYIENIGPGASAIYNDEGSTYYKVENNVMDISNSWGEYDRTLLDTTGNNRWLNPANSQMVHLTSNARNHGIVWQNNYSYQNRFYVTDTAKRDSSNMINNAIENKFGNWCSVALNIIEKAGITSEYSDNFRFGLRKIAVPEKIALSKGSTTDISYGLRTSKDTTYNQNLECVVKSSDESVVKIVNNKIHAVNKGNAVLTYSVKENGIIYEATTQITVGD